MAPACSSNTSFGNSLPSLNSNSFCDEKKAALLYLRPVAFSGSQLALIIHSDENVRNHKLQLLHRCEHSISSKISSPNVQYWRVCSKKEVKSIVKRKIMVRPHETSSQVDTAVYWHVVLSLLTRSNSTIGCQRTMWRGRSKINDFVVLVFSLTTYSVKYNWYNWCFILEKINIQLDNFPLCK